MQPELSRACLLKIAGRADFLPAAATTRLIFLSLPHRFFCKCGSAVLASDTGAALQHLKQNPPADLVKSLSELAEQRALTETVKTCQSFLHSPRRRCQAALLLLQAAQTASPPSLCPMHQTTFEESLKLPQDKKTCPNV